MPREHAHDDEALPQPARLWTVSDANARLDGLREVLPRLRSSVVRLRRVHDELERLSRFWGRELDSVDNPDLAQRNRLREEAEALGRRLEEECTTLQGEGIEVKDLESGLVDFYGYVNGEVVFLCWQRGEDEIGFYHTLDGGYRTRRPLPDPAGRTVPPHGPV